MAKGIEVVGGVDVAADAGNEFIICRGRYESLDEAEEVVISPAHAELHYSERPAV